MGPYSLRVSLKRVTWSTPSSTSSRQFSPSQLSASPWLAKIASCCPAPLTTAPSVFSYRHVQGIEFVSPVSLSTQARLAPDRASARIPGSPGRPLADRLTRHPPPTVGRLRRLAAGPPALRGSRAEQHRPDRLAAARDRGP